MFYKHVSKKCYVHLYVNEIPPSTRGAVECARVAYTVTAPRTRAGEIQSISRFEPCATAPAFSATSTPAGLAWTRVVPNTQVNVSLATALESVARTGVPPNVQPLLASLVCK